MGLADDDPGVMRDSGRLRHRRSFDPLPLDGHTAERILDGLDESDLPPTYAGVASTLAALSGPGRPDELASEPAVVAAFAAGFTPFADAPQSGRRRSGRARLATPRLAVAAAAGGLALSGGLAAAATGSLPGVAQSIASKMLGSLGIHVPGPNDHAGNHPDTRGNSNGTGASGVPAHAGPGAPGAPAGQPGSGGQGSAISGLAQTTTASGVYKGATICTAASGGQCQAGQHGASAGAPVAMPNHGGTRTANTASNEASVSGTTGANNASGGASSAGSGNASAHPASTTPNTPSGAGSGGPPPNRRTAAANSASTTAAGNGARGAR